MVIRILGMHAVNTVNINTYRFIECFPMMHIRMYMYAVGGGNLPRLSNSAVRISPVD